MGHATLGCAAGRPLVGRAQFEQRGAVASRARGKGSPKTPNTAAASLTSARLQRIRLQLCSRQANAMTWRTASWANRSPASRSEAAWAVAHDDRAAQPMTWRAPAAWRTGPASRRCARTRERQRPRDARRRGEGQEGAHSEPVLERGGTLRSLPRNVGRHRRAVCYKSAEVEARPERICHSPSKDSHFKAGRFATFSPRDPEDHHPP